MSYGQRTGMNVKENSTRTPKQKRSLETCERIRNAALRLFCEKGYYGTTTNEIADVAGLRIGSFYSYFKDKDAVFMAILEDYHLLFVKAREELIGKLETQQIDREWVKALIESLVKVHEMSKDFNREIKILALSRPEIAMIRKKNEREAIDMIIRCLSRSKMSLVGEDIDATSEIFFAMISAAIDYIVFDCPQKNKKRIITATTDLVMKMIGQ